MLVSCQRCGARYQLPDGLLPPGGHEVHCTNCDHVWFQKVFIPPPPAAPAPSAPKSVADAVAPPPQKEEQNLGKSLLGDEIPMGKASLRPSILNMPPQSTEGRDSGSVGQGDAMEEPLPWMQGGDEEAGAVAPRPRPSRKTEPLVTHFDEHGEPLPPKPETSTGEGTQKGEDDTLMETTVAFAGLDDIADAETAEKSVIPAFLRRRPKLRRPAVGAPRIPAVGGGLILGIGLIVLFVLWFARFSIVENYPSTRPYYEALGIDVLELGKGLAFRNVTRERATEGEQPFLVVRGFVVNVSRRTRPLPYVKIALYDKDAKKLTEQLVPMEMTELPSGLRSGFTAELPSPPDEADKIEVTFARRPVEKTVPEPTQDEIPAAEEMTEGSDKTEKVEEETDRPAAEIVEDSSAASVPAQMEKPQKELDSKAEK